jgi:hypothetical protein
MTLPFALGAADASAGVCRDMHEFLAWAAVHNVHRDRDDFANYLSSWRVAVTVQLSPTGAEAVAAPSGA